MNEKHDFQKYFIVFSNKSHVFSRKKKMPGVCHNLNDMGALDGDDIDDMLVSNLFICLFALEKYCRLISESLREETRGGEGRAGGREGREERERERLYVRRVFLSQERKPCWEGRQDSETGGNRNLQLNFIPYDPTTLPLLWLVPTAPVPGRLLLRVLWCLLG